MNTGCWACGGIVRATHGLIRSHYPPDVNCLWTISVAEGYVIRMNFFDFQLQRPHQGKCEDFLRVRKTLAVKTVLSCFVFLMC